MAFIRSSSGLLLRDDFSSDTKANYTESGGRGADWSVTGGVFAYAPASGASTMMRRDDITTAKCVTARIAEVAALTVSWGDFLIVGGTGLGFGTTPQGYLIENDGNTTTVQSYMLSDTFYYLNYGNTAARTQGTYYLWRLYISGGHVYAKQGQTALANLIDNTDSTYTQGHIAFGAYDDTSWDWIEARTSQLITCSGMIGGHYLRVSDGTTVAEAVASGGTASVDAGLVLFPLASVQIRTASGGGGSLVEELDTGDYADMGGGDVFAYSFAPTIVASQVASDIVVTWS